MQNFKYAFFEGKITKLADAKVSIMTNALQYGTGIFSGIRGYYNASNHQVVLFRIEEHYKRFFDSIKMLGCGFNYTLPQLLDIHTQLLLKNAPQCNTYFRPFAYVSNYSLGPNLANVVLEYALYMIPLEDYLPTDRGLSLKVSSWRRISDNSIPARGKFSGAYLNSALARKEAADDGYDEAIFLTEAGHVCEGSVENIFIVRDGDLITPPPGDDVLEGITQKTVIQLAADMGINTIVRSIDRSELYVADEVFLTGTGCQLSWVQHIDKRQIANSKIGPITQKLKTQYLSVVHGKLKQYKQWYTIVKII